MPCMKRLAKPGVNYSGGVCTLCRPWFTLRRHIVSNEYGDFRQQLVRASDSAHAEYIFFHAPDRTVNSERG
jgi:hypothetical protein